MNKITQVNELLNCVTVNSFFDQLKLNRISLTCIHINIRSIIKNFSKLLYIVHCAIHPIDIIIVSEVGISNSLCHLFNIPGYTIQSQLRSNKKGGGIIIYVKNYLKFTQHVIKLYT